MKKIIISFLSLCICSSFAQTVVTLQGLYLHAPVAVDSIVLQNLSRPSTVSLPAPPDITSYDIDLESGTIINKVPDPVDKPGSRLLVNQPGYARFRLDVKGSEMIQVTLFDLNGKTVQKWLEKARGENVYVDILAGFGAWYVCTIETSHFSSSFKLAGNLNHYNQCQFLQSGHTALKASAFEFVSGDKVLFSLIKAGMHRNDKAWYPINGDTIQFFLTIPCPNEPILTDIDGNQYNTVLILNKCWMKENLRVKHYDDGTPVPDGTGVGDFVGQYMIKYWFNYNDDPANAPVYGLLYTAGAATHGELNYTQGICPNGWFISSDSDWCTMERYYDPTITHCTSGPDYIVGWIGTNIRNFMMTNDTIHWKNLYGGQWANNETGFTALPAGQRGGNPLFRGLGYTGGWWVNGPTYQGEFNNIVMPYRILNFNDKGVWRDWGQTYTSNSVRCTKPIIP